MRAVITAGLWLAGCAVSAANPTMSPAMMPKLIGLDVIAVERAFGQPPKPCLVGSTIICTYPAANGREQMSFSYKDGRVSEVHWWPKVAKRMDLADLGLSQCHGPLVDFSSGERVWNECGGGLSARIENSNSGTFSISVSRENFLTR